MRYFKNTELARMHSISEGTVRRWIAAASEGKNNLLLHEIDGKSYIANTAKNIQIIKKIIQDGKKHANNRWHKIVSPKDSFYSLYNERQIADIITNIDVDREIPLQYSYFGNGAEIWDQYAQRLLDEEDTNSLRATLELFEDNFRNFYRFMKPYKRINIIDLGAGNALPVRGLLEQIINSDRELGRYIAIDISKEMLDIAETNIKKWFKNKVHYEGYSRDITYERFDDLLIKESQSTLNIVLLLGGTMNNFKAPDEILKSIYNSMGRNAIFVLGKKLDSDETRRYFDFHTESSIPPLSMRHRLILSNMGIDESLYSVIQGFDQKQRIRYIKIQFKVDVTLSFKLDDTHKGISILKDEPILLWRARHYNQSETVNELVDNNFSLLETSVTDNEQFIMTICRRGSTLSIH